jgi:DNA adenine methylase
MADLRRSGVSRDPGVIARGGVVTWWYRPFQRASTLVGFSGGILSAALTVLAIAGIVGLDCSAGLSDAAGMTYTGGKNGAGVYQRIINLMPPHRVYIEPFLGSGAIFRLKRPAELNIGLDLNSDVIAGFAGVMAGSDATGRYRSKQRQSSIVESGAEGLHRQIERAAASRVELGDASSFLKSYPWRGDELVYCDPPYLLSTRKTTMRDAYPFEMRDVDHREFLRCVRMAGRKAKVLISGYWSEMYAGALEGWNSTQFQAVTRGGTLATEWLWFNYPVPTELHDYSYLGDNYRERERIKRKKRAWVNRLAKMPRLERQSLLAAFADVGSVIAEPDSARSPLARSSAGDVLTAGLSAGELAERI